MQIVLVKLPIRERWRMVGYNSVCFSDIVDFIERRVKIVTDLVIRNIQDVLPNGGRNLNAKSPSSMKLQTRRPAFTGLHPESRILRPLVFRDSASYQIVSDKHVKNLSQNMSSR